ncbi:glycosyltransferase family 2 protein [Lysobacter xanthus]
MSMHDPSTPRGDQAVEPAGTGQVTVIIPTYNRAADLLRALQALALQTCPGVRVLVVDNSSTDGTQEQVTALIPQWKGRLGYIRREPNGPASARNTGLAAATTPYVLFHDSDIELPPDWIANAVLRMRQAPELGAVGGHILYAFDEDRVNAYGGDMGLLGLAWDVDEGTALDRGKPPAHRIWINCSAMLADADAVRRAGGFDETFFYGYEDSDLGWRLCLTGRPVSVFPELEARHHVDADPGFAHPQIVFHYCKNRLRTILKNAGGWHLPLMLCGYALYTLADMVLRAPRAPKWRALAWNLSNLGETLALRRQVQARRAVPDAAVLARGGGRWGPPSRLAGRRRRPATSDLQADTAQPAATITDDRL